MSEKISLALSLEDLEIESLEAVDADAMYLESIASGVGMTEMGASYQVNTASLSCSCCIGCCCCC
jgi:hypothetical protein